MTSSSLEPEFPIWSNRKVIETPALFHASCNAAVQRCAWHYARYAHAAAHALISYCLSKTSTLLTGRPCPSVPFAVIVSVLPSFDTARLRVVVAFPAFLFATS